MRRRWPEWATLALLLVACKPDQELNVVRIVGIEREGEWGCMGTNYRTIVEHPLTGERDFVCGLMGSPGEEFTVKWPIHHE